MNRLFKQFIYGLFYLFIIGLVAVPSYYFAAKPEAVPESCFDGVKNQDETDADCGLEGGKCIVCDLKRAKIIYSEAKAFSAGESAVSLFVEIENGSSSYGLRKFDYRFQIFSKFGSILDSITRSSSIYPEEKKHLVVLAIDRSVSEIGHVQFDLLDEGSLPWEAADALPNRADISISGKQVSDSGATKILTGDILNGSDSNVNSMVVYGIGYSEDGQIFAISPVTVENIPASGAKSFKIFMPNLDYKNIEIGFDVLM